MASTQASQKANRKNSVEVKTVPTTVEMPAITHLMFALNVRDSWAIHDNLTPQYSLLQ